VTACAAPGCTDAAQVGPFCAQHAKAPSGQRGGWISAARRRPYDATVISPRLWIGSKPPFASDLPGIDVLALCAVELQPDTLAFHGQVIRCPLPDSALDPVQARLAVQASAEVAAAVARGRRVLVTCHMGRNRSALVIALALHRLTTMSADRVIEHIRKQRPSALSNQHFVAIIKRVVGDGRRKVRRRDSIGA
jgi:protein-tyrosine phosphatase